MIPHNACIRAWEKKMKKFKLWHWQACPQFIPKSLNLRLHYKENLENVATDPQWINHNKQHMNLRLQMTKTMTTAIIMTLSYCKSIIRNLGN